MIINQMFSEKLRPKQNIEYSPILIYVSLIIHCDYFEKLLQKVLHTLLLKLLNLKDLMISLPISKKNISV